MAAIVAAAAVLAAPAGAAAKDHEVRAGSFSAGFLLQASNGYDLVLFAAGHDRVSLVAAKGGVTVTYDAHGSASRKGIEANFGPFGRVSVRLDDTPLRRGGGKRSGSACKGREDIRWEGIFRGTIEFRGENGYTEVDADRARGGFNRTFRQVCEVKEQRRKPDRPKSGKPPRAPRIDMDYSFLSAQSTTDGRRTEFGLVAAAFDFGGKKAPPTLIPLAFVDTKERVGKVTVSRSAFTIGDEGSLLTGSPEDQPIEATVTLPKPFSGTATYLREVGSSPSWTGLFGVRLPGAGLVPLTGEGFGVDFCQGRGRKRLFACLRRSSQTPPGTATVERAALSLLGHPGALPQGSGSQSQLFADARLSWSR